MPAAAPATLGNQRTFVIIGAGIGGLTAAIAIARTGAHVVIVERAAELSEAGAGIQLSPNAGRVLAQFGLERQIAAKGIEPKAITVRNATSGATLTSLPGQAFRDRYTYPYRIIHRADLQQALAGKVATYDTITLLTGATVQDTLAQGDGLLIRIATPNGVDVVHAAGIIAADGVWSATRETIAGSATAKGAGMTAWRATIPADIARDLIAMDGVMLWLSPAGHVVHYPVANGAALNVVAIVPEQWDKRGWSAPGERGEIAARFKPSCDDLRRVIGAPLAWHKYGLATVDPAGAWTAGRVALLGDAAHAMLPFAAQGAAMAIEDAAVLGQHLRGATDIPAALAAYAAERRPRVAKVAATARANGTQYHAAGMMAFARDMALKVAGARLTMDRSDWIYRWTPPET